MQREILFRGFHKCDDGKETIYIDGQAYRGEWLFGSLLKLTIGYKDIYYIVPENTSYNEIDFCKDTINAIWEEQDFIEVIPETICQYLDETDSHGHKLFWNDEIVVPELNYRRIVLNNKLNFVTIKNFVDNGTDFYYFKTIFDKELK